MKIRKSCFIVCLAVLAQGCGDRSARLASESEAPSAQVLREQVSFQIPEPEKVWGFGIVGNLRGTGSRVCPPRIRSQLRRMMSSSYTTGINLEAFILSPNTAVVTIEGEIPGSGIKLDAFDIKIKAYDDTGNCSLAGGWLYRTDLSLSQASDQPMLATVATAEGPVFIPQERKATLGSHTGLILGGGTVVAETSTHIILNEPGFKQASFVRNLINDRFGPNTARAMSPAQVDVRVPEQYREQRWRFWAVVEALPLADTRQALDTRRDVLILKLATQQDLDDTELALEAMGDSCVSLLEPHLQGEPAVAQAAARCLSNLGHAPGLGKLVQIAGNPQSPYRVQAMHALKPVMHIPQVSQFAGQMLSDPDFQFAMDVYESLCLKDGAGVDRETVAGAFTLDTIAQSRTEAVVATRSGGSHLALFGSPILLKQGEIIEFPDKKIVFDSRSNSPMVVISRQSAGPGGAGVRVQCSCQLRDIIRVLCKKPALGGEPGGFGLPYDELLALLAQLSEQGMIPAKLWAGPLPDLS